MKQKITKEELQEILRKHKLYLEDDENEEAERADLSNTDLSYVDLSNANLIKADLSNANLSFADLSNANLSFADLQNAILIGAKLNCATLFNTNLRFANLVGTDLSNAELNYAILFNAKLNCAFNIPYIPMVCPEEGEFYGYKKVYIGPVPCIAKLIIPAEAKRSSATTRECRCEFAKVFSITSLDRRESFKMAYSEHYNFKYKVGETVYPDKFDEERWNECSNGIHFFIQRQEAVDYDC